MTQDFIRLCAATPEIRVADCAGNAARIAALIRKAAGDGAAVVVLAWIAAFTSPKRKER